MQSLMVEGCTRVAGKSQGYQGLAIRDGLFNCSVNGPNTPEMVTAWEPMPDELERIMCGAPIEVRILGNVPPPMLVTVGKVSELTDLVVDYGKFKSLSV